MGTSSRNTSGIVAILTASLLWGTEFVVQKDVLYSMGANYSNAIRFAIGAVLFTAIFYKKLKKITKLDLQGGVITGTWMGLGYAFQTMGLAKVSVAVNAFLSASYVIMIPFILWILTKIAPSRRIFFCALLTMAGVFFISSDGGFFEFHFSLGEILTLLGAVFYAAGIISIDRYANQIDAVLLTIIQAYVITMIALIFAVMFETPPECQVDWVLVVQFLYMSIFASMGTQILMNYGLKYVSASQAGILFPSESVFATVLGVIFLGEVVSGYMLVGCILIVAGIVFAELKTKTPCL